MGARQGPAPLAGAASAGVACCARCRSRSPRGESYSTRTRRHDTTFYPSPGSFNSSDRFARLAMLKSTANLVPWQ